MPTWSPDDQEIASVSTREHGQSVWAVHVVDGTERQVVSASGRVDLVLRFRNENPPDLPFPRLFTGGQL